jgi:hypothetical protein
MSGARRLKGEVATVAAIIVAVATLASCSTSKTAASGPSLGGGTELVGLLRLTPGATNGGQISGTWFRMLQPGGNPENGPYMKNANSSADGGLVTLLQPGTSGGLRTGGYQSQPTPAFDGGGNSLADAITVPTKFFGVKFSISTNPVDPQTKTPVAPPTVVLKDGKLTADLSSWAASWNNQNFNQGAPKPVRSTGAKAPGQEQAERAWDWVSHRWLDSVPKPTVTGADATGSYDPKTGAFVLEWTSYIVGGPFNSFTGIWHLQGVFEASGRAPAGA